VRIVSNWEWAAAPANSRSGGQADARRFLARHAALGGPDWAPCYYSIDTPASAHSYDNYAQGWLDIIARERLGVYGDGALFRQLKADGFVTYAWQSLSRSFPGNSHPDGSWNHDGADIIQTSSGHVGAHSVDFNTATITNYGGWLLGEEDPNMAITPDDAKTIAAAVWNQALGSSGPTAGIALQSTYNATKDIGATVWHSNEFTPGPDGKYTESGSARMDRLDVMAKYVASPKFVADIAVAAAGGADANAIATAVADLLAARLAS